MIKVAGERTMVCIPPVEFQTLVECMARGPEIWLIYLAIYSPGFSLRVNCCAVRVVMSDAIFLCCDRCLVLCSDANKAVPFTLCTRIRFRQLGCSLEEVELKWNNNTVFSPLTFGTPPLKAKVRHYLFSYAMLSRKSAAAFVNHADH